ncbi:MAG: hypothetical protein D6724_05725 [Armatimonadetes bacterium]|nr:MAG: hypothetical protein D6724_05725 [Armatimonadota bacterium]
MRQIRAFAIVILFGCLTSGARAALVPVFLPKSQVTIWVNQPDYAAVQSAVATFDGLTRTVVVSMTGQVAFNNGDAMILKAYFNDGTVLVGTAGAANVPNIPLGVGAAKLIRAKSLEPLAIGTISIDGDTVTMSVTPTVPEPGDPIPPEGLQLERVGSVFADAPNVSLYGMALLDLVPESYVWATAQPSMWASISLFSDASSLSETAGRKMDYDPGWRVPPVGLPKVADIDGDGRLEWDSDSGTHVEGNTFIDGWVTDDDPNGSAGDSMVVVIGHDTNQDGKLQPGEISHIIGQCVFVPGLNSVKIFPIPGGHVVHVWNWKDTNGNGKHDPGEPMRHYIYNTTNGKLKVFDENGNLLFHGTPEEYFER